MEGERKWGGGGERANERERERVVLLQKDESLGTNACRTAVLANDYEHLDGKHN